MTVGGGVSCRKQNLPRRLNVANQMLTTGRLRYIQSPVFIVVQIITLLLQEGTLTATRGRKAHQAISREVVELCEVNIASDLQNKIVY